MVLGIGLYLRKFASTSEDFLMVGRDMFAWVAGLSFQASPATCFGHIQGYQLAHRNLVGQAGSCERKISAQSAQARWLLYGGGRIGN
jgi:hypothetical protein